MTMDNIQLVLQIISVIGVPILTALITWITRSLKRTNERIDELKDEYHKNRLKDVHKLGELSKSIAEIAVSQQHSIEMIRGLQLSINRMQDFLNETKK